jgi:hypothetical protein
MKTDPSFEDIIMTVQMPIRPETTPDSPVNDINVVERSMIDLISRRLSIGSRVWSILLPISKHFDFQSIITDFYPACKRKFQLKAKKSPAPVPEAKALRLSG